MNAHELLRHEMQLSSFVLNSYVQDLSDQDLLIRPGPGCNHLAWQLGHLILSEAALLNGVCPGAAPQLPEGFEQTHGRENTASDDPSQFLTLQAYQTLQNQIREATLVALDKLSANDLDRPSPEAFQSYAPTVGAIFSLIASHPLMHAGQFVPVRRQLGKPIVI